jgi:hypothetical protein
LAISAEVGLVLQDVQVNPSPELVIGRSETPISGT